MRISHIIIAAAIVLSASSCSKQTAASGAVSPHAGKTKIAVVGDSAKGFSEGIRQGAEEAAKEIGGIAVIVKAPETPTAQAQAAIIDALITEKVDAIALNAVDTEAPPEVIAAAKRAIDAGIRIVSIENDIGTGSRTIHLDATNLEVSARSQIDHLASLLDWKGEVAIIAGKSRGQRGAIEVMKSELGSNPQCREVKCIDTVQCDDDAEKAYAAAKKLLSGEERIKGVVAPSPVTLLATARAIQDLGLTGRVVLTGLGVPSEMKSWVESGVVTSYAIKNPIDLGYSAIYILHDLVSKKNTGAVGDTMEAGRIGSVNIGEDTVAIMGEPYVATKETTERLSALF